MIKLIFLTTFLYSANAVCSIQQKDVWDCLFKDTTCINPKFLHRSIRKSKINAPMVLAMEGPRYHKLFKQCDSNNNGCIDREESSKCIRSCTWRNIMHQSVCH